LTSEQLAEARAERMRQNGLGTLTLEDARTWMEETGLCLFLPKRQFSSSVAPSFLEAVAGRQDTTPDPKHIALAEELLVRLELDGVAVRLNLMGQPGEQPDFVVAAWVLPYVYALRGDRDWRRSPQLTGSRQVSQLAVLAYKHLEGGDATISQLKQALGREVSEVAVLRAITELWQQLRIIPVVSAPGQSAKWQLLRTRFQRAIAEGASTSQVTAISVLASIYLQAVIAASMEEVELFLAPLTARSKIREVLRGLVATRQVHTISMGHAPHFYVAGTLPEFETAATVYASSAMPASAYFMRNFDREEESPSALVSRHVVNNAPATAEEHVSAKPQNPRTPVRKPAAAGKPETARPHFGRSSTLSRDRKPSKSANSGHSTRRGTDARPTSSRTPKGAHPASPTRWAQNSGKSANGSGNGQHNGNHGSAHPVNGARSTSSATRPSNGAGATRPPKPAATAWTKRNGHAGGLKSGAKSGATARKGSVMRKDSRPEVRAARGTRKPPMTAGAASGNSKRFGFTARAKQGTKKRG
jgi:23S rRNA pseudouridine2605 synthase